MRRTNKHNGKNVGGRAQPFTLFSPGPQPESPILIPARMKGEATTVYVKSLPVHIGTDFRVYCHQRGYKLRHALLCLMRWASTNDIKLEPIYKEEIGTDSIHIRSVPIYTSRNFHAYCLKRGYEIRYAVAALMLWAASENIPLAGAEP